MKTPVRQILIPDFYSFNCSGGRPLIPLMFVSGKHNNKSGFKNLYTLTAYYGWGLNNYPVRTQLLAEMELEESGSKKALDG